MKPDGLDKWIDKEHTIKENPESILSISEITRLSLKERILELERMRDQILYELDKLKLLVENREL